MGRALAAVGSALILCFVVLGAVVYFTRDEDAVAVDNLLAERIGRAFTEAGQQGDPLELARLTPFAWDRVVVYTPGTPKAEIDRALGFEFPGEVPYSVESSEVFVFAAGDQLARFADYRGSGRFEGLDRPVAVLTPAQAVFDVRDGVARPRE